jgi:hypothetical protein
VGSLALSEPISLAQGGKFSPRGNLWVSIGFGGQSSFRLAGIDSVNGKVHHKFLFPSNGGADEAEGLDIYDLDADTRVPAMRGQIHVQTLKNEIIFPSDDRYSIIHFRIDPTRM